ncbi:MAG: class I adenylate-forming enzyme family protein [Pseudomonadota bacterium]
MNGTLLDAAAVRDNDSTVWVEPSGLQVSAAALTKDVCALRGRHRLLAGRRVALRCQDSCALLRALIALDGFCAALLLVHPGTTDDEFSLFCETFHPDAILDDSQFLPLLDSDAVLSDVTSIVTSWIIPTSGTTGTPKLIPHTLSSLARTVKKASANVELRWGLLFGGTRFAGLQVFLQSLLGGGTLLIPPDVTSFDKLIDFLVRNDCNALSATATMWRKILMLPSAVRLQLRQATIGGEIADQHLLDALHKMFPQARIFQIYASTEVGVGFTVKDGVAGFPVSWLHDSAGGTDFKVKEDVLWLRRTDARQHRETASPIEIDDEGFINTGDRVKIDGDRVYFLGRDNGAINVGGNKVSPEEVEAVLMSHSAVLLALARGYRNPFSGHIVVADVVLQNNIHNKPNLLSELQALCRSRLAPYKVPARIAVVESLSINESGKIIRRN